VNTSLINREVTRTDLVVVPIAANQIATAAGSAKAANMVALGAFLGASGIVDPQLVKGVLSETFAGRPKIVALNDVCLSKGFEIGRTFAPAMAGR
jgi:2-oxoglutarate ferredoxin oxidoreductase subunit gamma